MNSRMERVLLGLFWRIALLANFLVFFGLDTAFVFAFFASSLGFLAAGFCKSRGGEDGERESGRGQ